MPSAAVPSRQRGQTLVILALAFTALLGIVGVAVDLGAAVAQRRQAQNGAISAALAGVQTLGRHYEFLTIGPGGAGLSLVDVTDAMILQAITAAAAASILPFPHPATAPSWPAGNGDSLLAYYLVSNGAGGLSQGPQVGAGTIPATAAGVRVVARLRHETLLAHVLGSCCRAVDLGATARAELRPLGKADAGGPFIVCGGGPNAASGDGAWIIASAIPSHIGTGKQILDFSTTPPRINPEYVGDTLQVHDSQLGQNRADCGGGNSYKGNEDPNDTCDSVGSTPLPCLQAGRTGNRTGPVRNRVNGLPGCAPNSPDGTTCVVILSVADSYQAGQFRVVIYAPFLITQSSANSNMARLLGAAMVYGQAGDGPFNSSAPGSFTVKLVPDS